jgi:hypothetical protein
MPAGAAQLFRDLGYECRHVSELGMQRSEDEDILALARDHGWTVVTLDTDFHAMNLSIVTPAWRKMDFKDYRFRSILPTPLDPISARLPTRHYY